VNRSLFVGCLAVGVAVALGLGYGRFTEAAPASMATAHATSALGKVAALAPVASPSVASVVSASPEVARLDARRQLYESVDALVQASEFEKARKLLDEDQDRYGDDLAPEWRDLEQSYRLMADCLERPTAKLRVRAEAFVLVSQALSLKPRILAACSGKR
jgi:hypothetical protein